MSRLWLLVAILGALATWAPTAADSPSRISAETVKTTVTAFSHDQPLKQLPVEINPSSLVGEYVAAGIGYTYCLSLRPGGGFACKRGGCLGVYERASGQWSIDRHGITLVPKEREGFLGGFTNERHVFLGDYPEERVHVVSFEGHYLLVRECHFAIFKKEGPSSFTCLCRDEARGLVEQEEARVLDELVQRELKAAGYEQ